MADPDPDENAAREIEEELGIPRTSYAKPCYLFKFPFTDNSSNAWCYVYY